MRWVAQALPLSPRGGAAPQLGERGGALHHAGGPRPSRRCDAIAPEFSGLAFSSPPSSKIKRAFVLFCALHGRGAGGRPGLAAPKGLRKGPRKVGPRKRDL